MSANTWKPVRYACGPDVAIGDLSPRVHGLAHYYRVIHVEVFPRSDLPFTSREAVAIPCESPHV